MLASLLKDPETVQMYLGLDSGSRIVAGREIAYVEDFAWSLVYTNTMALGKQQAAY